MKVYAIHLLNDYSGSPKVLMQLIKGWKKNNIDITLVTSYSQEGFLSNLEGVEKLPVRYRFFENKLLRLLQYLFNQFLLMSVLAIKLESTDLVYINTALPFGAAIVAKIKGCKIIYHLHETSINPPILKSFLFGIIWWSEASIIYVSKFLAQQEKIENKQQFILPNAIETSFLTKARKSHSLPLNYNRILMVSSLKKYKGVFEYISLAQKLPNSKFRLVLNANKPDIEKVMKGMNLPSNLTLFPTQSDIHPFYRWADLILNLSRPDLWIETFGLTIIEGMAYGLPAIVPPVGGIAELVENGENGFKIDCRKDLFLSRSVTSLLQCKETYKAMRTKALERVQRYSEEHFIKESLRIISTT